MGEGRRVSRTAQRLSSGWWLGALWVTASSVSASASAPPAIADAAGALEAATARWSLLKCPTPHAIELEPAEQSWIVRFRIMGAKAANQWRIDSRSGAIAGVCNPTPKLAAPSDLAGFVKALRAALPESKAHLDGSGVYAIRIRKRTGAWRVGFGRIDLEGRAAREGRDQLAGETTVVVDARSFRARLSQ